MKTMKIYMVSLFFVSGFLGIANISSSQDIKLTRQELKEVRKAQMEANFYILDSLLNARAFVLEADYLSDRYGNRAMVLSNLNFIKVTGENGILQTGAPTSLGYNGVGGVTAEGRIGTWKISKNSKNLNYTLHFSILSGIGPYDIVMFIGSDGRATATITGLNRGSLTWQGYLVTTTNSRIFKGQNTI